MRSKKYTRVSNWHADSNCDSGKTFIQHIEEKPPEDLWTTRTSTGKSLGKIIILMTWSPTEQTSKFNLKLLHDTRLYVWAGRQEEENFTGGGLNLSLFLQIICLKYNEKLN